MTDYSQMSDFEINSAVARSFGLADFLFFEVDREICNGPVWEVGTGNTYNGVSCSKGNPFNPCSNPADAWPIIIANEISLEWECDVVDGKRQSWCCASAGHYTDANFQAGIDENPLRAAMITYLKLKGAENAPAI